MLYPILMLGFTGLLLGVLSMHTCPSIQMGTVFPSYMLACVLAQCV